MKPRRQPTVERQGAYGGSQAGLTRRGLLMTIGVIGALLIVGVSLTHGGSKSTTSKQGGSTTAGKASARAQTTDANGYVLFPQWGVRAKYTSEYGLQQTTHGDVSQLSSVRLTSLDKSCADHAGEIVRFRPGDDISPSGSGGLQASSLPKGHGAFSFNGDSTMNLAGSDHTYAYVGGAYYVYYGPTQSCGGNNDSIAQYYFDLTVGLAKSMVPSLEASK